LRVPCGSNVEAAADPRATCSIAGTFVRSQNDTITVASAESTTGYGLSAVQQLEVSQGSRSHWAVGAGIGFVVGAGVTYLVSHSGGSTSPCDQEQNQDALGSGECLALAALGGVAGAGLGALFGSFVRSERWQNVPLDQLRVGLTPGDDRTFGLLVVLRIR